MAGEQAGDLVGEKLPELRHGRVGELGEVQLDEPALLVDHEDRGLVVDLVLVEGNADAVVLPDALQLRQRPGEVPPLVEHPVQLRVGEHVVDRGRLRVGVDAEQLNLAGGRAEHRLGVDQRGGGQRADGGALGVVERQDDHLPPVGAERHRLAELVGEGEVRRDLGQGRPGIEVRVALQRRVRPRAASRRAGRRLQHRVQDDQGGGHRDEPAREPAAGDGQPRRSPGPVLAVGRAAARSLAPAPTAHRRGGQPAARPAPREPAAQDAGGQGRDRDAGDERAPGCPDGVAVGRRLAADARAGGAACRCCRRRRRWLAVGAASQTPEAEASARTAVSADAARPLPPGLMAILPSTL